MGSALAIDPAWLAPLTLEQYHRMIDTGVIGEDDHVELLEGVMVAMSPQGVTHAWVISFLNELLTTAKPAELRVLVQSPLTLSRSEPEPDLALVRVGLARPRGRHPETAELVVEVATDSLAKDLGPKVAIYAEAGIREYWVVNLVEPGVVVHRDPDPVARVYRSVLQVRPDASLAPLAAPSAAFAVAQLFRPQL
jgi:Uma2 family endonuclease